MGRLMGIEPTNVGTTIRCVNHFATTAMAMLLRKKPLQKRAKKIMEEEEGFEPPRGLTRLSVFKTDPFSRTWVFLQQYDFLVAAEGIEPPTLRV
jgi:hypothetical protein